MFILYLDFMNDILVFDRVTREVFFDACCQLPGRQTLTPAVGGAGVPTLQQEACFEGPQPVKLLPPAEGKLPCCSEVPLYSPAC